MDVEQFLRNAKQSFLHGVGVGHGAAEEYGRASGKLGERLGNASSRAGFCGRKRFSGAEKGTAKGAELLIVLCHGLPPNIR